MKIPNSQNFRPVPAALSPPNAGRSKRMRKNVDPDRSQNTNFRLSYVFTRRHRRHRLLLRLPNQQEKKR